MGELNYSGNQAIGYDKVLLVEGRTDIKTVQQFLRLYGKDHKVVLLPLGGSQLINGLDDTEHELMEIQRISQNVSALIDSELPSADAQLASDRQDFVELCEKLDIPCHVLERRALENYFPEHAIQADKGQNYRALGEYELLKDCNPAWGKRENWRIARHMTKTEVAETDLGGFLKDL